MHKWVYDFGNAKAEGGIELKDLLGGKGAGLAEMSKLALPVPNGFTIVTSACNEYYKSKNNISAGIKEQVESSLKNLEKEQDSIFGGDKNPLLVSVRSGARASMPGMMDTILNVGLNDVTVKALANKTNNERFAYDCYRRLIQMYSNVVLEIETHNFESILATHKRINHLTHDSALTAENLKDVIEDYKALIKKHSKEFPQDVNQQLWGAIEAVFRSWNNERAIKYREIYHIPQSWGTAVNIQSMVFGNYGDTSGTGVCFTRNPSNGRKEIYGEFLVNAQGEDVVSGIRTPQQITVESKVANYSDQPALEELMPSIFKDLCDLAHKLEKNFKDMQDIEFTVQEGKLWLLQVRSGKRTPAAGLKIAVDMVEEGMISKKDAILSVDPQFIETMLHPTIDPSAKNKVLVKGLPASPGVASGVVVFCSKDAVKKAKDISVILVRNETSPEDIAGMNASAGILTVHGGMTSHAAVVARGMGKPCIVGANHINIDFAKAQMNLGNEVVKEGDYITINGANGDVMLGKVQTVLPQLNEDFKEVMSWADEYRTIGVRANADTPHDALISRQFGVEGIGLCRTEHMFFAPERIVAIREMIFASNESERMKALDKILPYQRQDFIEIFKVMEGLPVTIRLLDPPLHEFLPKDEGEIIQLSKDLNVQKSWIDQRIGSLKEYNPMLGHRGCRLAITYPEIYNMQVRAIFEAVCELRKDTRPEIMVPLVLDVKELEIIKLNISEVAEAVQKEFGYKFHYSVGTMIELPRAALLAGEIAAEAEFFSFGTNDLTQTTYGISRDDGNKFLTEYKEKGVFAHDPFEVLDTKGVGQLMEFAIKNGKATRSNLKVGLCGEHGGNPESINFCNQIGLDYVSCSPYRVPVARLAAAQAALRNNKKSAKYLEVGQK